MTIFPSKAPIRVEWLSRGSYTAMFIFGIVIALLGGILGMDLAFPVAHVFAAEMSTLLPVFHIHWHTLLFATALCLGIGLLSAALPTWRASRVRIASGLSHVG